MASDQIRGSLRKTPFSNKQDLTRKIVFDGEINRSYESLPGYSVKDKKGGSWTIKSAKSIEELLLKINIRDVLLFLYLNK